MNEAPNSYPPRQPPYSGPTPQAPGGPVCCPRCGNAVQTRFCSYCGADLAAWYAPPQQPGAAGRNGYGSPGYYSNYSGYPGYGAYAAPRRKRGKGFGWLIAGICVAAVALIVACVLLFSQSMGRRSATEPWIPGINGNDSPALSSPTEQSVPQGISADELAEMKVGMSYALVSQIAGGDGTLQNPGGTHDSTTQTTYYAYAWRCETDADSYVIITFVDGRATELSDFISVYG